MVPVVKMIGLTMGLTVWGVTNMLNGWFQGKYVCMRMHICPVMSCGPKNLIRRLIIRY